jgi:hypothetical protein
VTEDVIIGKLKVRLAGWQTPVEWPNEIFNRTDGQAFIRVQVFPVAADWAGVGTTKVVSAGLIMITVFVPRFSGSVRAGNLAAELLELLKSWKDGGLRCEKHPPWVETGPEQPIWLARIVRKKYEYHECEE